MSKRDRQGVRTASDLERKYDFGSLKKGGNQNHNISQLMQSLAELTSKINNLYPVGSIYISANNIEPSTLFGGSWLLLKQGYLLVGTDTESEFAQLEYLEKCKVWKRIEDGDIAILDNAILDQAVLS